MAFGYKKGPRSSNWNYGGEKWRLSRSKIDLFMQCPRCFYIDNKLGVARPKMPSFTLNIAVDALLKKEFDIHRDGKSAHPLMKAYHIDAVPFQHKNLDIWRDNFQGVACVHDATGLTVCGAIDDVWVNPQGELIVVDYKATAKDGKIDSLDDTAWQNQYKRQMEVYQWLLRQNGFKVSDTGYFVYVNGRGDKEAFDGKLEFDVTLIPHTGNDAWVEKTLFEIKDCLSQNEIPPSKNPCDYCNYVDLLRNVFRENAKKIQKKVAPDIEEPIKKKPIKPAKKKKHQPEDELDVKSLFEV